MCATEKMDGPIHAIAKGIQIDTVPRPATTGITETSPLIESVDPRSNHLLASLPEAEWQRWQPQLERFEMPLGKVLYESGAPVQYAYFPTNAIVSLLYVLENGSTA